jgi:hypothetical protein
MLQYNILDTVKRFKAYETIGDLFHEATDGVVQLSVTDRIWGVLQVYSYLTTVVVRQLKH